MTFGAQRAIRPPAAKINADGVIVAQATLSCPFRAIHLVLGGREAHRRPLPCQRRFFLAGGSFGVFREQMWRQARQTRQPGCRPATRITPPAAADAPKNRVAFCAPRVYFPASEKCHAPGGAEYLSQKFAETTRCRQTLQRRRNKAPRVGRPTVDKKRKTLYS